LYAGYKEPCLLLTGTYIVFLGFLGYCISIGAGDLGISRGGESPRTVWSLKTSVCRGRKRPMLTIRLVSRLISAKYAKLPRCEQAVTESNRFDAHRFSIPNDLGLVKQSFLIRNPTVSRNKPGCLKVVILCQSWLPCITSILFGLIGR